jgi:hypothetical protein
MSKVHERALVLKAFLTVHEQLEITNEVLSCHRRNENDPRALLVLRDELESSPRSITLNTGTSIGESIALPLPKAEKACRRAFHRAAPTLMKPNCDEKDEVPFPHPLHVLAQPETPLTGTALVYGRNASMKPHYDSPTQPNQTEEWLCIISFGLTMVFRCDNDAFRVESGDALVMDSMAVLHGVESILPDPEGCAHSSWRQVGLPSPSRLGLVVWQGRSFEAASNTSLIDCSVHDEAMEGMGALFEEGGDP